MFVSFGGSDVDNDDAEYDNNGAKNDMDRKTFAKDYDGEDDRESFLEIGRC